MRTIAVTGGKGGVGKTNISANLAVALADMGKRTLLLDADLGLANLDVVLGLSPKYTLADLIAGRCTLDEVIIEGPGGVLVVPAASGRRHMAELAPAQHIGLVNVFSELERDLDVMVIDTAAGITDSVLTFCQAAQDTVVVVCDEPASITDAYALIKVLARTRRGPPADHRQHGARPQRRPPAVRQALAGVRKVPRRCLAELPRPRAAGRLAAPVGAAPATGHQGLPGQSLGTGHCRNRTPYLALAGPHRAARQRRVLRRTHHPTGSGRMSTATATTATAQYRAVQRNNANDVVTQHADLVRRIAHHLAARLPASVEVDDLIQAGMIGLIEASRSYDSDQGASFETYASIRIRGSMIDEIRRGDWVPRSVHRRARDAAAAVRKIEQNTGRAAAATEVAAAMEMPLPDYLRLMEDAARGQVLSLESRIEDHGELDTTAKGGPNPQQMMERGEFGRELGKAIGQLPEREQLVLSLYYEQELNLKEIGAVLGVSESRVCQIHGQAVVRLRGRLKVFELADAGVEIDD